MSTIRFLPITYYNYKERNGGWWRQELRKKKERIYHTIVRGRGTDEPLTLEHT